MNSDTLNLIMELAYGPAAEKQIRKEAYEARIAKQREELEEKLTTNFAMGRLEAICAQIKLNARSGTVKCIKHKQLLMGYAQQTHQYSIYIDNLENNDLYMIIAYPECTIAVYKNHGARLIMNTADPATIAIRALNNGQL
jgi:hypothetical protein